jgi:tRNA-dihydrouridine synthase
LIVNGDIGIPQEAAEALRLSGADGVMVGRAAYGASWAAGLIARAAGDAEAGEHVPAGAGALARYVIAHHRDMLQLYGEGQGIRHARKHLGWYLDRFAPGAPASLRSALMTALEPAQAHRLVAEAFGEGASLPLAA